MPHQNIFARFAAPFRKCLTGLNSLHIFRLSCIINAFHNFPPFFIISAWQSFWAESVQRKLQLEIILTRHGTYILVHKWKYNCPSSPHYHNFLSRYSSFVIKYVDHDLFKFWTLKEFGNNLINSFFYALTLKFSKVPLIFDKLKWNFN